MSTYRPEDEVKELRAEIKRLMENSKIEKAALVAKLETAKITLNIYANSIDGDCGVIARECLEGLE